MATFTTDVDPDSSGKCAKSLEYYNTSFVGLRWEEAAACLFGLWRDDITSIQWAFRHY